MSDPRMLSDEAVIAWTARLDDHTTAVVACEKLVNDRAARIEHAEKLEAENKALRAHLETARTLLVRCREHEENMLTFVMNGQRDAALAELDALHNHCLAAIKPEQE